MFKFFKKKEKANRNIQISKNDFSTLAKIFESLPKKYHFILNQLNDGFLNYTYENKSLGDNWFSFGLDQEKLAFHEYNNPNFSSRVVSNIKLITESDEIVFAEMHLLAKGIFCAYRLNPKLSLSNLKVKEINVEEIKEEVFTDEEHDKFKDTIESITNTDVIRFLDLDYSFVLEAFDEPLRTIKYFGNGDYVCVDEDFNLYRAYNNPKELQKIGLNLKQIKNITELKIMIDT